MNDQDLKQLWRRQQLSAPAHVTDQEMLVRVKQLMGRFDRTIFWRDMREFGGCAMVAILVGPGLLRNPSMLTRIGIFTIIASCLWIALTLLFARRGSRDLPYTGSVRDCLMAEVTKVARQIWLLRFAFWWYALPLLLGAAMTELGYQGGWIGKGVVMVALATAGWVVHWLNQRALPRLLQLKTELEGAAKAVPEFSAGNPAESH